MYVGGEGGREGRDRDRDWLSGDNSAASPTFIFTTGESDFEWSKYQQGKSELSTKFSLSHFLPRKDL